MEIKAKDDDEAGTINAEIFYSIVSQEPESAGQMFTIDGKTGKLYVKEPTLDREVRVLNHSPHAGSESSFKALHCCCFSNRRLTSTNWL